MEIGRRIKISGTELSGEVITKQRVTSA
jgi:hypothetical protein